MQNRIQEFENLLGGFYLHNNYIVWVYFNPDAVAGGQIVINYLSPEAILAANALLSSKLKCHCYIDVAKFDNYLLENVSKCELIDIDDPNFGGSLICWLNENKLAADETSPENRQELVKVVEILKRGGL